MLDLAERGLLRSYVLTWRNQYVGQISGYQYGTVYTVTDMAHNREFAAFSPGTTTLYLAIEDLLAHRPVGLIDMGFGEPRHRHSTQVVFKYSRVILFRKGFVNWLCRGSHAAFRSGVLFARTARERSTPACGLDDADASLILTSRVEKEKLRVEEWRGGSGVGIIPTNWFLLRKVLCRLSLRESSEGSRYFRGAKGDNSANLVFRNRN